MARSSCKTVSFCSGVRLIQLSNSALSYGVSSTISPSAKNCDIVMPKPAQIASSVAIEGTVLRRKMFAEVDSDSLQFWESRDSDQPRSVKSWRSLSCVSIPITFFLKLFYAHAK